MLNLTSDCGMFRCGAQACLRHQEFCAENLVVKSLSCCCDRLQKPGRSYVIGMALILSHSELLRCSGHCGSMAWPVRRLPPNSCSLPRHWTARTKTLQGQLSGVRWGFLSAVSSQLGLPCRPCSIACGVPNQAGGIPFSLCRAKSPPSLIPRPFQRWSCEGYWIRSTTANIVTLDPQTRGKLCEPCCKAF